MNIKFKFLASILFVSLLYACKDEEIALPDNLAQFDTAEQGISDTEPETTVSIKLSRAVESATILTLGVTPAGLTYGTEFTTVPAIENSTLSVTIPAGGTEATFKLIKSSSIFLSGTESVTFTLKSVTAPVLMGTNTSIKLQFASIVSSGTTLQLSGLIGQEPGSSAGNAVFADLSNNQQTAFARAGWDLGFLSGSDFRVIINNTTSATAKKLDKTDLNTVTAADTVPASGWSLGFTAESFDLIDDVQGDLTKTAISEISATEADNKVYILNRGTGGSTPARPWVKIRIIRKGTGYTLQYANISDTTFKTLDIAKDDTYNFNYITFGSATTAAPVTVEPKQDNWDIKWTYALYKTSTGTEEIPYAFSDLIAINTLAGVTAAEVMTSSVSYDAFAEAHIASVTFSNNQYVIGPNWRVTSSQTEPVGVRTNRFYVLKDKTGNIYKIKFLSFHANDGGERGKPKFEYKLVKKGA